MVQIQNYIVTLRFYDGTEVVDYGVIEFPQSKIINGHYVMERDDGGFEMYNLASVRSITFHPVPCGGE